MNEAGGILRLDRATAMSSEERVITFRPDERYPGSVRVDGADLERLRESGAVRILRYARSYSITRASLPRLRYLCGQKGCLLRVEE